VRDIEFLPDWYPMIRRRYRVVVFQAYTTVVILFMLGAYALVQRYHVYTARQATKKTDTQIGRTKVELAELSEKLQLQGRLQHEDSVVARLGIGVDTTRLLASIQDAMPPGVALSGLTCETVDLEKPTAVRQANGSRQTPAAEKQKAPDGPDRRLNVVLDGLSPTDVQAAALVEKLNDVPYFQDVQLAYLRDGKTHDGRAAREFEVTFSLHLNAGGEAR
jgi:hypothetical protein